MSVELQFWIPNIPGECEKMGAAELQDSLDRMDERVGCVLVGSILDVRNDPSSGCLGQVEDLPSRPLVGKVLPPHAPDGAPYITQDKYGNPLRYMAAGDILTVLEAEFGWRVPMAIATLSSLPPAMPVILYWY